MAASATTIGSNSGTATVLTLSATGVSAGAEIIVGLSHYLTSTTVYTCSDSQGNTYTQASSLTATGRISRLWQATSASGGNFMISVTADVSTLFRIGALYATGIQTAVSPTSNRTNTTADPLYAAAATGYNVAAGSLSVGVITWGGSTGATTLDTDYSGNTVYAEYATAPFGVMAWRIIGGSNVADENMDIDVTTARTGPGVMASWAVPASASGSSLLLMSAG